MNRPVIQMLPIRPTWLYTRLAPLGDSTDSYTYANGVIAYYSRSARMMWLHASVMDCAVGIPSDQWPTIVAVAASYGLSAAEANQLAEAAELYAS
jgi:hypothetical protein